MKRTLALFIAVALTATVSYSKAVNPSADSERISTLHSDANLDTPAPMYGDFNENDKIIISDLIAMSKYISNPDRAYTEVLDCYLDGKVDVLDVLCLVNYLLGKEENLPVRTDYQPPTLGYAEKPTDEEVKLKTGGNTFTVVNWNDSEIPALLNAYVGNLDGIVADGSVAVDILKENPTTPTGATINFVNKVVSSNDISAIYNQMMRNGDDIDVFYAEADFILPLMGNDSDTAPMSDLGFEESDWANAYPYTLEVGKTNDGVLKAAAHQAHIGGYSYRADLAEKYLGAKSPEEMQALIGDWDKFETTAETLKTATNGEMYMTATIGGLFYPHQTDEKWVNNGKMIVTDTNRDFISMARRFIDNGYVSDAGQWSTAWAQLGQKEKTLGYFTTTWMYGNILKSFAGGITDTDLDNYVFHYSLVEGGVNSVGKWNVCQGPEAFYWGGVWTLVNPNTDNGLEARDFIYDTTINEDKMYRIANQIQEFMNNTNVMDRVAESRPYATEPFVAEELFGEQNYIANISQAGKEISLNHKDISQYDATLKSEFVNEISAYAYGTNSRYTDVDSTIEGYLIKAFERTALEVE